MLLNLYDSTVLISAAVQMCIALMTSN